MVPAIAHNQWLLNKGKKKRCTGGGRVKKLTIWQKLRNLQIAHDRLRRRREIVERKRRELYSSPAKEDHATDPGPPLHHINIYRRGKVQSGYGRIGLPMPENFCLIENYEAVSSFLGELRHRLNVNGQKLENLRMQGGVRKRTHWNKTLVESYTDFATLKRITPVTALVLASEYDRAISVFDSQEWLRAINVDQWQTEVFQTLSDVGFLSLLGACPDRRSGIC
jgi:hypothetical protein